MVNQKALRMAHALHARRHDPRRFQVCCLGLETAAGYVIRNRHKEMAEGKGWGPWGSRARPSWPQLLS
jgi:hypothetical protein